MSITKVRELLAHEIEVHAFRSSAGARSSLAILSSGLQGYLDIEEGLAISYADEAIRQGSGIEPKPRVVDWNACLRISIGSSLLTTDLQ